MTGEAIIISGASVSGLIFENQTSFENSLSTLGSITFVTDTAFNVNTDLVTGTITISTPASIIVQSSSVDISVRGDVIIEADNPLSIVPSGADITGGVKVLDGATLIVKYDDNTGDQTYESGDNIDIDDETGLALE